MKKIIYLIVFGIAVLVLLGGLRTSKVDSDFDLEAFAELPVQVARRRFGGPELGHVRDAPLLLLVELDPQLR